MVSNEYPDDTDLDGLVRQLGEQAAEGGIRVFTIAYGEDADLDSLERISEASRAAAYDATDPLTIDPYSPTCCRTSDGGQSIWHAATGGHARAVGTAPFGVRRWRGVGVRRLVPLSVATARVMLGTAATVGALHAVAGEGRGRSCGRAPGSTG